jgi:hypothetical protein
MPQFSGLNTSSSQTSITVGGNLAATFTATSYHLEWFKPTVDGCDESGSPTVGPDQVFSPNTTAGNVSATATGLTPNTRYCARLVASNDWGDSADFGSFPYQSVTTLAEQTTQQPSGGSPSVPDCSVPELTPFATTVYKGTLKKGKKSKKFTVTLTSVLEGANLRFSTKVKGIPSSKVTLKFNGEKVKGSATLTTAGTLAVTMPKGKKTITKKLQVIPKPAC